MNLKPKKLGENVIEVPADKGDPRGGILLHVLVFLRHRSPATPRSARSILKGFK